jgi:hypothetical protein
LGLFLGGFKNQTLRNANGLTKPTAGLARRLEEDGGPEDGRTR